MKRYMLDTDMVSYVLKGSSEKLIRKIKGHSDGLCVSVMTLAELLFGAAKKNSPRLSDAIDLFKQLVEVCPWTEESAKYYAIIRNDLEKKGSPVGHMDIMIAANAMSCQAVLVTNNSKHFSRISGLKCENWLD